MRRDGEACVLGHREWRARVVLEGKTVRVRGFATGYRAREVHSAEVGQAHRAFVERFGYPGDAG